MNFNKEQLETLKQADYQFHTALEGWVKYATRSLCDLVADTYFAATGQKIPRSWSCSTCVLNLFKRVGRLYFEDLTELEVLENKDKESESKASNELEPKPPEEPTKRKSKKAVANKNSK